MAKGFFVTGTDTNVGKTYVTGQLMKFLGSLGFRVGGMKPVASGGEWVDGEWRNEDALLIRSFASIALPYDVVNPYAFRQPVSPHLAARLEQREVCLEGVLVPYREIQSQVDCVVVEALVDGSVLWGAHWISPILPKLLSFL